LGQLEFHKLEVIMATRNAFAQWEGTIKEGKGRLKLGSGAFEGGFTWASRFEDAPLTNPEELLGAAHAACFSMSLGSALTRAGHPATRISTTARVHLTKMESGFSITRIDLETEGTVLGIDEESFLQLAQNAKSGCIISRALSDVEILLTAKLVS
jgi:osmotically inducible protein OsmC